MDPIDPWVDSEAVRKLAQSLLMPVRREEPSSSEVCFGDGFVGFASPELVASPTPRKMPVIADLAQDEPDPAILAAQLQHQARQSLAGARNLAEHGGLLERPAVPVADLPLAADPTPGSQAPAPDPAAAPETVVPTPVPAAPEPPGIRVPEPPAPSQAPFVERLHGYGEWLKSAVQAKAFFVSDHDGHVLMDQVRSPKLLQVARTLAQASHAANRHAGGAAVGSLHVKLGEASILEVLPIETEYGPLILGIVVPSVLSSPAINVISSGLQQVVDGHPH